jgi:N-acetyl-gamma-glutamyl-phosphate reductase
VKMAPGVTADQLRATLSQRYEGEYFIRVLPNGSTPATRHVRGSNFVIMSVHADRVPNRAILMAVEDNLVKGASGQAVQNMNVMAGFPEETALEQMPMFP